MQKLINKYGQNICKQEIRKFSIQASLKLNMQAQGDKHTKHHGHYRYDAYNEIRHDKKWQARIIKREEENFNNWVEMTTYHYDQWRKQVYSRSDPNKEQGLEENGDYVYFLRHKEYKHKVPGQ